MIHSLSGGVIKGESSHRLIKAVGSKEDWYLCDDFAVSVGDRVIVPTKFGGEKAVVVSIKTVSQVPLSRYERVINVAFE